MMGSVQENGQGSRADVLRHVVGMALGLGVALGAAWAGGAWLAAQPAEGQVAGAVSRADVQAATEAAVRGLKSQVDRLPLGPRLTVGEFLGSIRGADEFMLATLQRAQLVGGVRSLDAGTVQVRLDISGRVVADALMQIAGAYQKQTPHPPRFIAESTRAWSDQSFTATGLSTGVVVGSSAYDPRLARRVSASVRAEPGGAGVPGGGIVVTGGVVSPEAVEAAKRAAAEAVLSAVSAVELPGGGTGRDLTRLAMVGDAVRAHVMARPTREVERREDGSVRVSVSVDGSLLAEVVRSSAIGSRDPWVPVEEATWNRWREVIAGAMPSEAVGVFSPVTRSERARVSFPAERPPGWVGEALEAEGSASNGGSKLLTARSAENAAMRAMEARVGALRLSDGLTLAEAARLEPRYAAVVERAVARARVVRVEYFDDGSAMVRMNTDTRLIWQDVLAVRATVESLGG